MTTLLEKAARDSAIGIFDCAETPDDAKDIIMGHLAPVQAEMEELAKIRAVIKDPAAVWINMLRGEIARPQALDHYEECKAKVETLEAELDAKDRLLKEALEMVSYLTPHHDGNLKGECWTDCKACRAQDWLARSEKK